MQNALFLMYPSVGHYKSSFQIAEAMQEIGYEVHYAIPQGFQWLFCGKPFKLHDLYTYPFGLNIDLEMGEQKVTILKNRLNNVTFNERKKELMEVFGKSKPSVVFIDSYSSTDFIAAYRILKEQKIKVIFVQTMLSSTFRLLRPYLNSQRVDMNIVRIVCDNFQIYIRAKIRSIVDKIRFMANDDRTSVKRNFRTEEVNPLYSFTSNYGFGYQFSSLTELILNPKELDCSVSSSNRKQIYCGCLPKKAVVTSEVGEFVSNVLEANKKLIYVSFGTLFAHKVAEIRKLLSYLDQLQNAHQVHLKIIVSIGGNQSLKQTWNYESLTFVEYIDQSALLKHVNLFITHGDINSVKESIVNSVPMLVIPLEGDQIGNASKLVAKKLASTLSLDKLTYVSLENIIFEILKHEEEKKKELDLFYINLRNTYTDLKSKVNSAISTSDYVI